MKIHILGAAGTGKTALGKVLAQTLNFPYFDSDNIYWKEEQGPFMIKQEPEIRNKIFMELVRNNNNMVLSGSMINWGIDLNGIFDLVIFLYLPQQLRMQRLEKRELEYYGESIYTDSERSAKYREFMNWARGYDDNSVSGRTLQTHRDWMSGLTCPILEINGDTTITESIEKTIHAIKLINLT